MKIYYDLATTDHIPFLMVLNTGNLPVLLPVDNGIDVGKIEWSKLSNKDLNRYSMSIIVIHCWVIPKRCLIVSGYEL